MESDFVRRVDQNQNKANPMQILLIAKADFMGW